MELTRDPVAHEAGTPNTNIRIEVINRLRSFNMKGFLHWIRCLIRGFYPFTNPENKAP
jgi:hypothetical protein